MLKGRASLTALGVASARALASNARTAVLDPRDAVAELLLPRPLARVLTTARRTPVAARLTFGLVDHLALRTAMLDRLLVDALQRETRQVVIVGAGLDGRAHRLHALRDATVYELDHPEGQRQKRERARGLPVAAAALRYVPTDLEQFGFAQGLAEAGHDKRAPSFYLLEGLLPYLRYEIVERTVHELAATAAPGSRIAITYVTPDMMWLRRFRRVLLLSMRALGEPLETALPPAGIAGLLRNEGFEVEHDSDTRDWWRQLCPPGTREPLIVYERLVSAIKPAT
jgi:methyltransferase (TIGR00027 family)